MNRHYFISDNLTDLKSVEAELEKRGITKLQIHVLSQKDADVEQHQLHEVASFMKQDVVHSAAFGAAIGVVISLLFISVVHTTGLARTEAGWLPFIFVAIVLLGFCTWEGGLRGIQEPNHHFRRFQKLLRDGKHIFFVDVDRREENVLLQVLALHPGLAGAGVEPAGARWIIGWQQKCLDFVRTLP